jgi:hypothetical protein
VESLVPRQSLWYVQVAFPVLSAFAVLIVCVQRVGGV